MCLHQASDHTSAAVKPLGAENMAAPQQSNGAANEEVETLTDRDWFLREQQRRMHLQRLVARLGAQSLEDLKVRQRSCCDDYDDGTKVSAIPAAPDPADRSLSRRQWRRRTDDWLRAHFWLRSASTCTDELLSLSNVSTSFDGESICSE